MQDAELIYRLIFWLKMAKVDIDFLSTELNPIVKKKAQRIKGQTEVFEEEIKSRVDNYHEIFEDLTTDKIYAIQSVLTKMFAMSEAQCQELENFIETEEIKMQV